MSFAVDVGTTYFPPRRDDEPRPAMAEIGAELLEQTGRSGGRTKRWYDRDGGVMNNQF